MKSTGSMFRRIIFSLCAAMALWLTSLAHADTPASTLRWYFTDTTFYDGTRLTGYFDYNTATATIGSFDLRTQTGMSGFNPAVISAFAYNETNALMYRNGFVDWTGLSVRGPTTTDAGLRTSRGVDFIYWHNTLVLDTPGTVTFGPPPGNWGYENIRVSSAADPFSYSDTTRYLNAVTLTTVAPVPEPSTYALMLAGLGFVRFFARKRRKNMTARMTAASASAA